jgi:hypothetical protein
MDLAGGLLTGPHAARDSRTPGDIRICSTGIVGPVDDGLLLSRGTTRIPRVDDARVVLGFRDRPGALPRLDSIAVETLITGHKFVTLIGLAIRNVDVTAACALTQNFQGSLKFAKTIAMRTGAARSFVSIVDEETFANSTQPEFDEIPLGKALLQKHQFFESQV